MRAIPKKTRIAQQSGIVLIICMIVLLLLVLLMMASIGTVLLEERMAGNLRQQNIAFQAAESALREAESLIALQDRQVDLDGEGPADANPFHPLKFSNGPFQNKTDLVCVNGLCGGDQQSYNIRSLDESWTRTANTGIAKIKQPQYIIELITHNPYEIPDFGDSGRTYAVFRITARAWGEDPNSFVILQSTYKLHALSFSF